MPFLDSFMIVLTQGIGQLIAYALLVAYVAWRLGYREAVYVLVGILFSALLANMLSIFVLKPAIGRLRPCQVAADWVLHLPTRCTEDYSFPSSHASNSFALLFFTFGWLRNSKLHKTKAAFFLCYGLVSYTLLFCYTRIYLGVHYPLDLLAGMILGALLGYGTHKLMLGLARRKVDKRINA